MGAYVIKKILIVLGAALLLAAIAFVDYGVKTQCPDVAIYVKCYE